ncbi:MAG: hypothetical protein CHACPFDD_03765 [Phycisphaerae bacterium]|nr:hypothetical protein [Phycisphaerae bacterium]
MPSDPYCGNCGYSLVGLTESSKCPECGKPLVEVLQRGRPFFRGGRRFRSELHVFGLPLVDVALGPHGDELTGKARGIIAVGDSARGWLAIGGRAVGFIAIGGVAIGFVSIGGLAIGLLTALGGGAIGGLCWGGGSVGAVAHGGGALGFVAEGGGAVGYYARGGGAYGRHVISMQTGQRDPDATVFFMDWQWLVGAGPRGSVADMTTFVGWILTVDFALALLLSLVVTLRLWPQRASRSG